MFYNTMRHPWLKIQCNILEQSWPITATMQNLLGCLINHIVTTAKSIVVLLHDLRCFFNFYSLYSIKSVIQNAMKDDVAFAIPLDLLMFIASTSRGERKGIQKVVNISIPWSINSNGKYKVHFKVFSQINESIFYLCFNFRLCNVADGALLLRPQISNLFVDYYLEFLHIVNHDATDVGFSFMWNNFKTGRYTS